MEGINSRLDEAEDQISDLEYKAEKNTQAEKQKEKRILKNENLINILNNMKHNTIDIMGILEGEVSEQGIKNLVEEIMTENISNLVREKDTQVQEVQRVPHKMNQCHPNKFY